jgi:RNA 2',3'-cyclic 3'-phosphodiesterase
MRLFTGISLPPNVVEKLSAIIDELQPIAHIRWSAAENLHITSKFVGQWPDEKLDELKAALKEIAVRGPIPIAISRFGFLPNANRPHVFFAGVQAGPHLAALAETMDEKLALLGVSKEARPYQPHVTLARIKPNDDIRAVRERVAHKSGSDFGTFDVDEFHLYLSTSAGGRTVYTRLATYDLKRETP